MKNIMVLLVILLISPFHPTLKAQQRWNFRLQFINMGIGPVNTFLYLEENANTFTMHSAKNADRRILGFPKATLARTFKKMPKGGYLIQARNGRIVPQNTGTDSLYSTFIIPMIGVRPFAGIRTAGKITGALYADGKVVAQFTGYETDQSTRFDYTGLAQQLLDTTRRYIYDKSLLERRGWKKFERKLTKIAGKAADDAEMFFGVNMQCSALPFSHFNLILLSQAELNTLDEPSSGNITWKEIDPRTAYVEIKSFGGEAKEMDSIFLQIMEHPYHNLIVDLRDNPGGGIQAGLAFGKYTCPLELNAGYFVTNQFYANHQTNQNAALENLPATKSRTTMEFIQELKSSEGRKLVVSPGNTVFKARIYVLTSQKTASTCEPIVYALKSNKLATIVGEKTAGAMLSSSPFYLKDNFTLILPLADYYTVDNKRLDLLGVEPDIPIAADNALEHVLKMVNE